jgi:hypothetical protein
MFKVKPIKAFIAGLLSLGLAFGFATAMQAPAHAANLQGCISSNYNPNNCQQALSASIALTVSNINQNTSTAITPTSDLTTQVTCSTGTKSFALYPKGNYADSARLTTVAGLAFNTTTGVFSGTTQSSAFAATEYEILAQCSDSTDLYKGLLSITVVDPTGPVSISPATQTVSGTTGSAITASASFSPTNFSPLPTYAVTSGTLPAGLTLNTSTGVISGTPTATNSASVTITATNTATTPQTATATVTFSITAPTQQSEPDRKVTICHRTHSETNPYVRITVDYNSVNRPSGHQGHDEIFAGEHVFKAGIYKRAKDKDWGDIIPADPSGQNRWQPLNWTTLGQQIYNGTVAGCPSYDPFNYYNALRESGVPEGKIKAEIAQLETEQSEANPSRTETDETTLNYTGSSTKLAAEENDKVTICHATNATTNPYRKITVSASSITNKSGHYGHDDIYLTNHVYNSEVNYPANQKDWGDIIPADPTGQNRWQPLNWTPLGQKIYNGEVAGCGEQTTQEIYNILREDGLPKKEVVKDLKAQKNVDDDLKELDEIEYTGNDPETERTEPKEPTLPTDKTVIDQSLSGIVWLDLNRDGLKDPDEPFMPNITLSVVQVTQVNPASYNFRTAGVVRPAAVVTVKTDANGFYIFPSLGAGDWKVVTGIPDDLGVTYDSEGGPEGEVTTTVPVGSSAFTWVGLVGDTEVINEKLLEEILLEYPSSLPLTELPTWLQEKVTAKLAELEAAANGEALAYTGSEDLAWLFFGVLIMLSGMLALVAKKR